MTRSARKILDAIANSPQKSLTHHELIDITKYNQATVSRALVKVLEKLGYVKKSSEGKGWVAVREKIPDEQIRLKLDFKEDFEIIVTPERFTQVFDETLKDFGKNDSYIIYAHGDRNAHEKVLNLVGKVVDDASKQGEVIWISHIDTRDLFQKYKNQGRLKRLHNFYYERRIAIQNSAIMSRKNGGSIISNMFVFESEKKILGRAYYYKNKDLSHDRYASLRYILWTGVLLGDLESHNKKQLSKTKQILNDVPMNVIFDKIRKDKNLRTKSDVLDKLNCWLSELRDKRHAFVGVRDFE